MVRWLKHSQLLIFSVVFGAPFSSAHSQTNDFDGKWTGHFSCIGESVIDISHGKISGMVRGMPFSGSVDVSGKFSVEIVSTSRGDPVRAALRGQIENARLLAEGTIRYAAAAQSPCRLIMTAAAPHPDSFAARYLRENPTPLVDTSIQRPVDPPPVYVGLAPRPVATTAPSSAIAGTPRLTTCELKTQVPEKKSDRKASAAELPKPKLYALAIGVSRYRDASINLTFASKDACDVARWIATQEGTLYRQVTVRVLHDEHATRDAVLEGLEWIVRETTAKDVAMIFLAGHGVNDATGEYFYLPHDANVDSLSRTAVPQSDIRRALLHVPGKAIMFVDTCHSGQIMAQKRSLPPDISRFVDALVSADNGAVAFSASTGRQFAVEDDAWGNGAFTMALLEGLSGKADYNRDRSVTMIELDLYLSERVKELTGGRQAPTTAKPSSVQDFPLSIVR